MADETTASARLAAGTDHDERMAAVQKAVSDLPLDQRTAIVLFEYEEKSMAEIATILGCTSKAVENRLYRARRQLRRALGNEGTQRDVGSPGET